MHLLVFWLFLCHDSLAAQALKSRAVPPGDTPFRFCNDTKNADIFTIGLIQLDPKPVLIDQVFHVNAYGNFSKDVPGNSTLKAHGVYENYHPGHNFTTNFCDYVVSIDQIGNDQCPPKKGPALVVFEGFTSPWDLPFGHYSWRFEAFTPQQERLFCVEADVCLDRDDDDPRNGDTCPPVKERGSYIRELQHFIANR
ncbi:hypothetical protein BU26DRAFT_518541 [Trematosphaeria pertusa]|uniref:Phosphatidylglycerol/phosphatidylinositol transfer protein n=1 Tax=Trematosphaeria pertusa TaxID=390896 RepID=A0A6A6IIA8_9PLEO|nr:uncharacterized protein BU26DRAFT_518541 [Trematosphaeria pertusa]KAF2250096.1 hypothetical protein BU26DRAFT_518541 [Trematosphaeria pertusa]